MAAPQIVFQLWSGSSITRSRSGSATLAPRPLSTARRGLELGDQLHVDVHKLAQRDVGTGSSRGVGDAHGGVVERHTDRNALGIDVVATKVMDGRPDRGLGRAVHVPELAAPRKQLLGQLTRQGFAALETWLVEHHPFDLPEVIAVPVEQGLPAYLDWVVQETK